MARKNLGRRIVERLGLITRSEHEAAVTRAFEAGFEGGNDEPPSGDLKSYGYRRATAGSVRDFGGLDYDQVLNIAWRIFLMSPVAKRYLQIKRDYELGRGVVPKADDEALQSIVDDFWRVNKLSSRLKKYVLQLHLLGEQLFPVFVRKTDGRVKLGYIDPTEIEKVVQHPDNVLEKWAVVLKIQKSVGDEPWRRMEHAHRVYRIIREDDGIEYDDGRARPPLYPGKLVMHDQALLEDWEADMLEAYGLSEYSGSCFYFSRNDLSNQARGYTDLLQVADWIDQDESVFFDLADRENLAGYFFTDVTIQGADEGRIKIRANEIRKNPPKKGSINVHNDRETWNPTAPDLKQAGSIETGKELLTFILGGLGLPKSWYGYGDETNRATAQAQGDPTWRTMETDQDAAKDMVIEMLTFVRDQAELAGRWQPTADDTKVDLQMPEMTTKDLVQVSTAASAMSTALMVAVDRGWMTREHAAEAWAKMMAEIDVEINPQEEVAAVDGQAEQDGLNVAQDANDWYMMHGLAVPDEVTTSANS